jgi:uncharacterized phage protein (TIGR01671 family)
MNRELKFRVWNKEEKSFDKVNNGVVKLNSDYTISLSSSCKRYIVQQFTGLIDKNGKEIYEGDLVNFSVNNTHEHGDLDIIEYKNMDVHYSGEFCGFMFGEEGFTPLDRIIMTSLEVVGNIFEK